MMWRAAKQDLFSAYLAHTRTIGPAITIIDDLICYQPALAWPLLMQMIPRLTTEELQQAFADGPWEDFLRLHGEDYYDCIAAEALHQAGIRHCLGRLRIPQQWDEWEIPQDLLARLKALAGEADANSSTAIVDEWRAATCPPFQELIDGWLIYEETKKRARWVDNLVRERPERAWLAILELIRRAETLADLSIIAAGLLEDLLSEHGPSFIERVEAKARENLRFRLCLAGVWRLNMSDEIWNRVTAAMNGLCFDDWEGSLPGPDEPNREVDNHPPLPPGKARRQANPESSDEIYNRDELVAAYYHHEKASRPAALVDEIIRETPQLAWSLLNAFLAYAGSDEARWFLQHRLTPRGG